MPVGVFSKLLGTVTGFFRFGGPASPGINVNGAALETKNAANSALAVHRGAAPVGDNDFATKAYADTIFKPIPVSLQFNGGNALPANSATEQFYVVTTSGANATIGQVLWDDGTGVGAVAVLAAKAGNEIVTTATFTGGTILLVANQNYVWSGAAWLDTAPRTFAQRLTANYTNTSNVLTNVSLAVAMNANEVWVGEFNLSGQCSGAAGSKFAITIPAGATIEATAIGISGAVTAFTSSRITASGTATTQTYYAAATTPGPVRITFTVVCGATAGNIQLQAQSVSNVQTTTLFAGSFLTAFLSQ